MSRPVTRVILLGVVVSLSLGMVAGCARGKPGSSDASQATATLSADVLEEATAVVVLPVVGGADDADQSEDALATPTHTPSPTAALEPTAAPTELPTELPTTTVVLESTPAPPADVTHTVGAGETLLSIAVKYHTTIKAIVDRNGLTTPDFIRIGQTLLIPVDAVSLLTPSPETLEPADTPSPAPARTHVVQLGETLSGIAASYGLTTADLARANDLADPNRVFAGQELIIP